MSRINRRGVGESDPLDAHRIASAVLPLRIDELRTPRQDDGIRSALQVLLTARDGMSKERTRAKNALVPLLRDGNLGVDARRSPGMRVISEVARWRDRDEDIATATARAEAIGETVS